ncbi:uncharacterized protein TNCV_1990701 [Trichonephila clavipes]|nr:uncharacterized protein TNCV_1990701 [Trichonephila clavipes]
MQRDCALSIAGRGCIMFFSGEYKISNQSLFECAESFPKRVSRLLGRPDCVLRRCWEQWVQEMSFKRRPDSGHLRLTSHREDHHIVRYAPILPTASSAAVQAQVAPSLGTPVSSRTIRRLLAE